METRGGGIGIAFRHVLLATPNMNLLLLFFKFDSDVGQLSQPENPFEKLWQ